ncbi:MAG TPA: NAD(P)-dependent alcohol dehydrogenase [Rhizomicrobium sp.]
MSAKCHCQNHDSSENGLSRRALIETGAALGAVAALSPEAMAASPKLKTIPATGYAAPSATGKLAPFHFKRRDTGPKDVLIDILYCGVCHSDIHTARGEWPGTRYPCVPGHEILGRVVKVGDGVTRFKKGDMAAVGCLVDSCGHCASCNEGLEQFCENGATLTYNSDDKLLGTPTYGGYSNLVTVTEHFAVKVPDGMNAAGAAPLLCAGITTYSPLRHWKVGPGTKVGIVGIGGLGHVGVKIAAAMGAEVTMITTTPAKMADAARLGAKDALLSTDEDAMHKRQGTFDFLLSTIPCTHPVMPYVQLLRRDGTLVVVGALDHKSTEVYLATLVIQRKTVAGSVIGGLPETQEMLDFCAQHNIVADADIIPISRINEAYDRVKAKDVRYRFVIDMASI